MKLTRFALSFFMVAAFALGGVMTASAENAPDNGKPYAGKKMGWGGGKHKGHHQAFMKDLNLTAEQQAKIKSIRESFRESHKSEFEAMKAKHQELRKLKQSGADAQTLAAKREELKGQFPNLKADRERMMNDIKAVLTPEQRAKLEAKKAEFMQRRGGHHKPGGQAG
jgi:protein CpxP